LSRSVVVVRARAPNNFAFSDSELYTLCVCYYCGAGSGNARVYIHVWVSKIARKNRTLLYDGFRVFCARRVKKTLHAVTSRGKRYCTHARPRSTSVRVRAPSFLRDQCVVVGRTKNSDTFKKNTAVCRDECVCVCVGKGGIRSRPP